MKIVAVDEIPTKDKVIDVPTTDLMAVYRICQEMEQVCTINNGAGLAAVQVGIPWKLFVARSASGGYDNFVNCSYEPVDKPFPKQPSVEGCLSIRDNNGNCLRFQVMRWPKICIVGKKLDVNGPTPILIEIDEVVEGPDAVLYQHEIDHQNQILISDIGNPIALW